MAEPTSLRDTLANEAHDALCAVVDRVKTDDHALDSNEYVAMIFAALSGVMPDPEREYRRCDACFDEVQTLSTDDLCDSCVGEETKRCPNCGEWSTTVEPRLGAQMCASCEHNARRSGA